MLVEPSITACAKQTIFTAERVNTIRNGRRFEVFKRKMPSASARCLPRRRDTSTFEPENCFITTSMHNFDKVLSFSSPAPDRTNMNTWNKDSIPRYNNSTLRISDNSRNRLRLDYTFIKLLTSRLPSTLSITARHTCCALSLPLAHALLRSIVVELPLVDSVWRSPPCTCCTRT